jgi:hypothetical protein
MSAQQTVCCNVFLFRSSRNTIHDRFDCCFALPSWKVFCQ